jgi:soluble lytic murein transglycosylase-like protein
MRCFLAALALAGALALFSSGASADGRFRSDHRYQAAQGADARDVTRAKRCPPPFSCWKKGQKRPPGAAMLAMIDAAAAAEGVLSDLARALVQVESSFDPQKVGSEGEIGLTQIKPRTARGLGFAGSRRELFDPVINLKWGLRHAHLALKRGSIGFHQAGLHARHVSRAYVARIHAAIREEK